MIKNIDGTNNAILDGDHNDRQNPIEKCYKLALSRGYKVFALQKKECMSSFKAAQEYLIEGISVRCENDGTGGPWSNEVYEIMTGSTKH